MSEGVNLLLLCFDFFVSLSMHTLYIIVTYYLSPLTFLAPPSPRDFRSALALPSIGRPLGRCLAQFPRLCYWLTFLTLAIEVGFPMLVCGWSVRFLVALVGLFVSGFVAWCVCVCVCVRVCVCVCVCACVGCGEI